MELEVTTSKATVECYKIRHNRGKFWADINIDDKGKAGRIQIASDYGDWQNYWGACGSGFKQFLIGLDIHYAAGKLGADRYFDAEKTITNIRKDIIDQRREGNLTEDGARAAYNDTKELEDCNEGQLFAHLMSQTGHLWDLIDGYPDLCYEITPGFKQFWKEVWPIFLDMLKEELQLAI